LHPTTTLILWLAAVVAIQFVGYPLIFGGALLIVLFATKALPAWWQYVRRSRWLLLGLWLVLAYGVPGDALFDLAWMPTWQGLEAANLQTARLIILLGFLAWLFSHLGREGLISALWGLMQPLKRGGVEIDRLVVRLSLVLEQLKTPLEKGAWRQMLHDSAPHAGSETLEIRLPIWRAFDTLTVTIACLVLLASLLR
jgi:energy-coupling factor transporter transmembrane protein EcfT